MKLESRIAKVCENAAQISSLLKPNWETTMLAIRTITHQKLTRREIECLSLWLHGFSIKETARLLDDISIRTVQTFRENIKKKLQVKTYQQLFEQIQKLGLMTFFLRS